MPIFHRPQRLLNRRFFISDIAFRLVYINSRYMNAISRQGRIGRERRRLRRVLVAWANLYQEERLTKPQLCAVSERIAEIIPIWNTTGYSSP
jgi:hypothetical protein